MAPSELAATVVREAVKRAKIDPREVGQMVLGNVIHTEAKDMYISRVACIKGGLPQDTTALTVNRLCGPGIQSAVSGAQLIQLGEAEIVLTGGMENMSEAPHVIRGLRGGLKLGQGQLEDFLWEGLVDTHCGCSMAVTAENCAAQYGVSREEQDKYAIRSQQAAHAPCEAGKFADGVVPVGIKSRRGVTVFDRDDHMRPETTMEVLAKLPAAFSKNGCVTAGNASGIVDGGAALILASEKAGDEPGQVLVSSE